MNQASAIWGLGGIGKTQTAIEYAYRYFYDQPFYEWVLWVNADALTLTADFGAIATKLGLPNAQQQGVEEQIAAVQHWLETHDRWLLIFDNADDPALLQPLRPRNPNGRLLLTSRAQTFDALEIARPLPVQEMTVAEAREFLGRRTEKPLEEAIEVTAADRLAQELGYLPLALEQAGAYILAKKLSFDKYLAAYRQRRLQLLERQKPLVGNYPNSVATTWSINMEAVEQTTPAAAELLRFSAFLAPENIPYELLERGGSHLGQGLAEALADAADDPLILPDLLSALTRYSLIRLEAADCYSIHRMVQEVLQDAMDEPTRQQWIDRGIVALNAVFPNVVLETWKDCDRLVAHVQALEPQIAKLPEPSVTAARLLNQTGFYLNEQGRYSEAEPLYVRSLQIRETRLGADHPETATGFNNLAILYRAIGRYNEAEPLYVRSLQIRETRLGSNHPATAQSLNNLAELYESQGRYSEAEPLYKRSLFIRQKQLDAGHPDIAQSLNNLAGLYESQQRYSDAEPLFLRSLAILELRLGNNHPYVATSLHNLAGLYQLQKRYSEAELLYVRSLSIYELQLGDNHPSVAKSLSSFALLYSLQGRYSEAEPLQERSLQIREAQLGGNHPETANSLSNLALLYTSTERYSEAEPLYLQALMILFEQLGETHPITQTVWGNFVEFLKKAIQAGQAAQLSDNPATQAVLEQLRRS